ncbi:glycoside hydrolase family 33 protein [Zasmidium cellare ATCC 36951]|uniref:Glycoside hydrolase family 33 protein n=1 Tax=Zasmidium cellare ATCC 36951 TaxID=1080233 RepID=A0A6A6CF38_ZASCE|nr:glycoside hydrolase family 33 protein [Zasmidium cellare ATCC 36951]KAF2164289.1 glycoside hydrolase family 33 protein [Zasmidium cellare ATCC 36951]
MGSCAESVPDFDNNVLTETAKPFQHSACFVPAGTPQCHASNLLILDNGDLLCAWFGGTQEGKPDTSIYLARRPAGSNVWSKATRATSDTSRSEQNPVLFQTPVVDLWLLYTSQNLGDQDSAVVKRQISRDRGSTWGAPDVLFSEPGTFIRQPVVVLESGAWVIPTFKCRSEPGVRWVGNDDISAIRISQDQGQTWVEKEVLNSFGAVHMQIQQLQDRTYLALYRSRWADNIHMSTSPNGIGWSEPKPTALPNPNAGVCFAVLPSGRVLAVYNHSSRANAVGRREGLYDDIAAPDDVRKNQTSKHAGKEAFWGSPRAPLCLAWSDDNGHSWRHRVLEEGDGYCMTNNSEQKLNRELSYPSIRVGSDGKVHVAFTFWRQGIKYVEFDPAVLDQV